MSGKTNDLFGMVIDEISLVDDGANQHADVVIVKMKGGDFKPCGDCSGSTAPTCKKNGGCLLKKSGASAIAAFAKRLQEVVTEFSPAQVEKAFPGGEPADIDAATTAATFLKEILMDVEKLAASLTEAEAKLETMAKAAEKHAEELAAKDATIAELQGDIAKRKTATTPEAEAEAFMKSLPEPVRKRLEDAQKTADAATAQIAKMADDNEFAVMVAKAKTLHVGDATVVGGILHRVAKGKTTADDLKTLEQILGQASAVMKASAAFRSNGIGGEGADANDPEAQLVQKAKDLQGADKSLTFAAAYDKALEQNPAIYEQYIAKRRGTQPAAD